MCLASGYAEQLACNTSSDEQQEALHCDYLDAERIHYNCTGNYLGKTLLEQLRTRTRELVERDKPAVARVAEQLLNGQTLTHELLRFGVRHEYRAKPYLSDFLAKSEQIGLTSA
jgi:hypothetical protein